MNARFMKWWGLAAWVGVVLSGTAGAASERWWLGLR